MIYVIYFAFTVLTSIALYRKAAPLSAMLCLALLLATLAALRGPDVASDFSTYELWYHSRDAEDGFVDRAGYSEALYFFLNDRFSAAGVPFRLFIWLMAFVAITIKAKAIFDFARRRSAALAGILAYLLGFYLLHEFTQVRVGMAIAVLFIAFGQLADGHRRNFALLVLLATMFHSSAIALLVLMLPLGGRTGRWTDRLLLGFALLAFLAAAAGRPLGLAIANTLAVLDPRIEIYLALSESAITESARAISLFPLLMLALALSLLRRTDRMVEAGALTPREAAACILARRSFFFGLIFVATFEPIPELALRMLELYTAFLPLLAAVLFSVRGWRLQKAILVLWVIAKFVLSVLRDDGLVTAYTWFLN